MGFVELMMISIGLSMDAFAVSVCKGVESKQLIMRRTLIIAAFFGLFQAAMPLLGWFIGEQFEKYITSFDHWITFGLLAFIGGKMIFEALKKDKLGAHEEKCFSIKEVILLAFATSIDAFAVGVTFAFLNVPIIPAVIMIGFITFIICFLGVLIGNWFGTKYKKFAEVLGGVVLILLGINILIEHL